MNRAIPITLSVGLWVCLCSPAVSQGRYLLPQPSGGYKDASVFEDRLHALEQSPSQTLLRASVAYLIAEYGGRVALESYGSSADGVPLMMLRVSPERSLDPNADEALPVALVVPGMEAPSEPALVLRAVEQLLQPGVAAPNFEVCFAIAPNPDRWLDTANPRKVNLERNFPFGWDAWELGAEAPGAAPLSEPETRSLVGWLLGEPRVMGLVRITRAQASVKAPAGSLESYSEHVLALPWTVASLDKPGGLLGALEDINASRDFLAAEVHGIQRLAESLWCVDIQLANSGAHRSSGLLAPLDWHVLGGEVRASARSDDTGDGFTLHGAGLAPTIPGGGQEFRLRLIIETTQKESVFVRLATPRAEPVTVAVALQSDLPRPR